MKGALVLGLEDPGGRMSRLGKSEIAQGEILTVNESLKRLDRSPWMTHGASPSGYCRSR